MKAAHVRDLLLGAALSDGAPIVPVLQQTGAPPKAIRAAREGDLPAALRAAAFPKDLCALAEAWPAAVGAAQGRLQRLPSPRALQVGVLQTLGYLFVVALLQVVILEVMSVKVFPVFDKMALELPAGEPALLADLAQVTALAGLLPAVTFWLGVLLLAVPRHVPFVAGNLRRAREAAMAAGLVETGAPTDVQARVHATFRRLRGEHGRVAELDAALDRAVDRARAVQRTLESALRVVGFGLLAAVALYITLAVYRFAAHLTSLT